MFLYFKNEDAAAKLGFDELAERARTGDRKAVAEFRAELEPEIIRVVRRTMHTGTGNTPFTQHILTLIGQARKLMAARVDVGPEDVVRRVARSLCDTWERNLRNNTGDALLSIPGMPC